MFPLFKKYVSTMNEQEYFFLNKLLLLRMNGWSHSVQKPGIKRVYLFESKPSFELQEKNSRLCRAYILGEDGRRR